MQMTFPILLNVCKKISGALSENPRNECIKIYEGIASANFELV